ncbi:hypothetical protein GGR56DRAFT_692598 [Xylariaceae sp. FL0804]|nr:hypothetical protein GGR56DRAFT_692598 [Xylariaceae sp. FL0804]
MGLLQNFLHLTNFRNPFLRTMVPSVAAAFALQAAVAVPSIPARSERFFDASGSLTFLATALLSLYLPALRVRAAADAAGVGSAVLPKVAGVVGDLARRAATGEVGGAAASAAAKVAFNWRQVALTGAVAFWSLRLGTYLFQRILSSGHDSRFDPIRNSPAKFAGAWFGQAVWVSLCLAPVVAINAAPAVALHAVGSSSAVRLTDVVGAALFLGGFAFEIAADRQKGRWLAGRQNKEHDEKFLTKGLWSRSQYPNYFGEVMLWTGIATVAAGALVTRPVQLGLGFSGGLPGRLAMLGLAYASPAFVAFLLLKVTGVPMSEKKYDERYGDRKDYREWKHNTPKFFPKLTS